MNRLLTFGFWWVLPNFAAVFLVWGEDLEPAPAVVVGPWSGAVTTESARVHFKMDQPPRGVRLAVSVAEDFSECWFFEPSAGDVESRIGSVAVDGLAPDTAYHYAVESGGQLDLARRGTFRTFPVAPASFTFAFSACADTGSNHRVFSHIAGAAPLFFLSTGDFHYANIELNDPAPFRAAYDTVFASPRQSSLYRKVPLVYMWDDHDYGPNDSHRLSPGREAALQVYREYIPHYPIPHAAADAPIDQSFSVGKVRFIMSDMRSQRDPKTQAEGVNKRMMSPAQLVFFKEQVLEAQAAGQAVFWVSSVPWIQPATAGSDLWGGYATQRAEIADFLAQHQVEGMVILSGDAHMLAADDGANANFSADADAPPIRVLVAAALDRPAGIKGGPFSEGEFPDAGQYGLVTVTDTGSGLHVAFSGRTIHPKTAVMTETLSFAFSVGLPDSNPPGLPAFEEIRMTATGDFSLRFQGTPAAAYHVDGSEDLREWRELGVPLETEPGIFSFTDHQRADIPKRFYRIRAGD
jgi:hypothetical protein